VGNFTQSSASQTVCKLQKALYAAEDCSLAARRSGRCWANKQKIRRAADALFRNAILWTGRWNPLLL